LTSLLPIGFVLYLFYAAPFADIDSYILDPMPKNDIETMRWVASNTPADSSVLVLAAPFDRGWAVDSVSEWFPALSGRKSPSTVQGKEWLAGDLGMWAAMGRYNELKLCNDLPVGCLDEWAEAAGVTFTHVYIGKPDTDKLDKRYLSAENRDCCAALRASLATSSDYRLLYDGKTTQIYERRDKTTEASSK
jgi:hypothetical protein